MDFIAKVVFHLENLPWDTILIYLGSAGVIIPITQFLKNQLNNKTKQKVYSIVGALSIVPQGVDQLFNNQQWAQYLPSQFGWLFTTVILLHAFFASPVWRRLSVLLQQYNQALRDVRAQGNVPASSIDNPNLVLNQPSESTLAPVPQSAPLVEEKPLVIQG